MIKMIDLLNACEIKQEEEAKVWKQEDAGIGAILVGIILVILAILLL